MVFKARKIKTVDSVLMISEEYGLPKAYLERSRYIKSNFLYHLQLSHLNKLWDILYNALFNMMHIIISQPGTNCRDRPFFGTRKDLP